MTRWFVGLKHDGRREVFAESTGADPTARLRGYAEVYGPYRSAKAKPSTVRFPGLPPECKTGRVMFEEPRKVEASDGSFADWFGPFEAHVYRFSRK